MNKYFFAIQAWLICILSAAGQEILTLDDCRKQVLGYNPSLKQRQQIIESTEANISAKQKDYYPYLDMNGDVTYLQTPMKVVIEDTEIEGIQNMYSVSTPIVQNIYSGGAVRKVNELAEIQKNFAVHSKEEVEDYLLLLTEINFWTAVYNKELISLSQAYKQAVDSLVSVVKDKVESEIISRNDLLLLEVRQNEAELYQLVSKNQYEISIMELNKLLGYSTDKKTTVTGNLALSSPKQVQSGIDDIYLNRPEIRSQTDKISMQKTTAELTKSSYLPKVYAGIIPEWGAPNTHIGGTEPNYNTALTAGVRIPLVHWGKKKQEVQKELFLADAAQFELQEMKDKVSLEVTSSQYQLEEATKRKELTIASLGKAILNLDIMTTRYLEGLSSILEILDAQLYWQRTYKDMLDAQLYYQKALSYHKKALGDI